MKDIFPESFGQNHGCSLYTGVHHTQQSIAAMIQHPTCVASSWHIPFDPSRQPSQETLWAGFLPFSALAWPGPVSRMRRPTAPWYRQF